MLNGKFLVKILAFILTISCSVKIPEEQQPVEVKMDNSQNSSELIRAPDPTLFFEPACGQNWTSISAKLSSFNMKDAISVFNYLKDQRMMLKIEVVAGQYICTAIEMCIEGLIIVKSNRDAKKAEFECASVELNRNLVPPPAAEGDNNPPSTDTSTCGENEFGKWCAVKAP